MINNSILINKSRGEVALKLGKTTYVLVPSYANLVAAEHSVGPLFGVIDDASAGKLSLQTQVGVLWACVEPKSATLFQDVFCEACMQAGLAKLTPVFRLLMEQALGGINSSPNNG